MFSEAGLPCCENAAPPVIDSGYACCPSCGRVSKRELDVNHISFLQSVSKLHVNQYTRTSRFSEKIVGALLRKTSFKPNPNMILCLNDLRRRGEIEEPEDLLVAVASYKTTARRPYMHATSLWSAMHGTAALPEIDAREEKFIKMLFEEIFYVWTRLNFPRPRLPMGQAIVLIVKTFELSEQAHFLIRFIRKLKCAKRSRRYANLFKKCLEYIRNDDNRRERFESFPAFRKWADSRASEGGAAHDLSP